MQEPRGTDLLATLVKLLAEQEGVKIKYEVETNENAKYKTGVVNPRQRCSEAF